MSDAFLALLAQHARYRPDRLAIADRTTELTWEQLAQAVAKRALELPSAAVGINVAALHRPSDTDWLVDFLALRANAVTVVCFPSAIPRSSVIGQAAGFSAGAVIGLMNERLPEPAAREPWWHRATLAHLTSGTTGTAMGVPRSEENLLDEARAVALALKLSGDRPLLCSTPVAHSFASGLFLAALSVGAPTLLLPALESSAIVSMVERYRPTTLCGTPYVFRVLLRSPRVREGALTGVDVPMVGGAALYPDLATDWLGHVGVPLVQEYGLSEGGIATLNVDHAPRNPSAVGSALPGVHISIVDGLGAGVNHGESGRIVVERRGNPRFYVGFDGELSDIPTGTARYGTGVDTGDLGRIDESGLLHLTGRSKTLINVAGSKVAPHVVEAALLDHPEVQDAVVLALQDEYRGEVVGAVVECESTDMTPGALATYLRHRLSPHMVPRRWLITTAAPRTTSGKPDLRAIRKCFEESCSPC